MARHGAADQRRCDIVEEARQHEHDGQQRDAALPVVGKIGRHSVGHAAQLEMAREQRKPHQQQEQVGQDHPFVLHVQREAGEPGAEFEAGENELVERDGRKPGQRDVERVVVEQRDAEQRQAEQDEIDRDAEDVDRRDGARCFGCECRVRRRQQPECRDGDPEQQQSPQTSWHSQSPAVRLLLPRFRAHATTGVSQSIYSEAFRATDRPTPEFWPGSGPAASRCPAGRR